MSDQWWSWALSAIGIAGFYFAGKKIWWAWYINIANQILWTIYAIVSDQLGFLVAAGFYTVVFTKNAYAWTREHFDTKRKDAYPHNCIICKEPIGRSIDGRVVDREGSVRCDDGSRHMFWKGQFK